MIGTRGDWALRSRQVLTPEGLGAKALVIREGKIAQILSDLESPADLIVEDFGDWVVMPGLVDTHVHINEPGRTEWEGFETATKAAATGGITTLVDMPLNCIPVTTTFEALHRKLGETGKKLWVDCGFYGGLIPGNTGQIESMVRAGVLGFKAFLIHSGIEDFPQVQAADLREAMPILKNAGVPLLVHAELESGKCGDTPGHSRRYTDYLASRPREWELNAIELMISLAREYQCPVHIVHLSCSDALPLLERARADGVPITVETCPHYLVFESEAIADGDTRYKCAPPIREAENREKLWQGLCDGIIDFIISDHSPCEPALKRMEQGDFEAAWGGIASLQFGLSSIWTELRQRGLAVSDLARWMCERPADFVGLGSRKGRLAVGNDADLVVWDPEAQLTVAPGMVRHRHKVTPYQGRTLYGVVQRTILHGDVVYNGEIVSPVALGRQILGQASGVPV